MSNKRVIELLAIESSKAINVGPGITTVTFFSSDNIQQVNANLKARFFRILEANPWLAGRIVRPGKHSRFQLHFDESLDQSCLNLLYNDSAKVNIHPEMPFPILCRKIAKDKSVAIGSGSSLINKDLPLIKISISAIKDNRFAIIFSLSHTIADGATFHNIQNMLYAGKEIVSLNVVRHKNYSMEKAVGEQDNAFLFYKSFMLNIVKNMIFGKKPRYFAYYLNQEAIKKTKASIKLDEGVPYISTNDIITSSFFRAVKARIGLMAVNFRNRFEGIKSNDAGNYEGVKLFDPDVYITPQNIRKALQSGKTHSDKMPNLWERTTMRISEVNNWASFSGGFTISSCQPILHLPVVYDIVPFDIGVLFNPKPGKVALLILAKHYDREYYKNSKDNPLSQYLGETVSEELFSGK